MSIRKAFKRGMTLAAVPALALGLVACATPFRADVSRFESQMPAPQGESFFVVADDPALSGGLEFSMYADDVAEQMRELGYAQAPSAEAATMLVRLDYGVSEGRERIRSTGFYRDPFYNDWYGYARPVVVRDRRGNRRIVYLRDRRWGYGWNDSFFGRGAFGPDITSYTVYTSGVDLKIDDAATGQRLFEGQAEAASTSNRLQYLVPNLVEALFTDFPGNSGETVRISIAPEDQPVRRGERR
ncbi:DUF4136 domain-containing protein [Aurantiacibacter spongiae]|uniref:DUF4136 domain-containing protein n=1 Tax=Aurantiacibacter spongiae TaxID=2488860 RepID=A0A3N5DRM5_9SPHN|nr:DUF4136 domain-containing protein [Aurantiacibacter spongiae]RPF71841.1 DUF4136 domain-containing protein [Aurantiacibacter spongiae]